MDSMVSIQKTIRQQKLFFVLIFGICGLRRRCLIVYHRERESCQDSPLFCLMLPKINSVAAQLAQKVQRNDN